MRKRTPLAWHPSIRVQLTLWYTTVFALLLLLAGMIFFLALRNSLVASLDTDLRLRTQQVAAGISFENGAIVISDITGELPDLSAVVPGGSSVGNSDAPNPVTQKQIPSDVNLGALVRVLDTKGTIVYVSPAFRNLTPTGTTISQPLNGVPWAGMVTAHDGQAVSLYSAALTENGQIFGVIQVGQSLGQLTTTLNQIGTALLILLPIVLLLTALGSYWLAGRAFAPIVRLTQTARDIEAGDLHQRVPIPTAHDQVRDLALTLNAMIARLEEAFARQRRFIADASHELRTPVAAVLSLTENALDLEPEQDHTPMLHEINAEALRLRHLITNLLSLARADEGHLVLDHDPVRLDLLLMDVVESLTPLAEEQGQILVTEHLAPVSVVGDASRLILIVMSLVDNALMYTNAGGTIALSVCWQNGNALICVSDTGMGIAADDLPHIFERFYRADPARSRSVGGSGLGLAIAQTFVELHGGSIEVASTPGEGTTFTMTLPGAIISEQPQAAYLQER